MAAYAPYILMAAGTAAKMSGDEKMERERRRILNRSLQRSSETTDKTAQEVAKEGEQYNPATRALDMQAAQEGAFQRAQADVRGAGGDIVQTASDGGNNSSEFVKAKADRTVSEGNRITDIAREMARTRSTGDVLTSEGLRRADLASRVNSDWNSSNARSRADQLDSQNVATPALSEIGTMAQMVGAAWAGGAGMGEAGAANAGSAAVPAGEAATAGSESLALGAAGSGTQAPWWSSMPSMTQQQRRRRESSSRFFGAS